MKGAGKITTGGEYQLKRQITTIVDGDDKNCLVQLTVVQKLNQGARRWLYIIAGVLFLVLSFAQKKERTKEKHTGNDIQPLPDALIKL